MGLLLEMKRSRDFPGFYYDAERGRYFRLPPVHFTHLPQYTHLASRQQGKPELQVCKQTKEDIQMQRKISAPFKLPRSLFDAVSVRQYGTQLQECTLRSWYERVICSLQRRGSLDLLASYRSITSHTDMTVNELGDLLAIVHGCIDGIVLTVVRLCTDTNGDLQYTPLLQRQPILYAHPGQKIEFLHRDDQDQLLYLRFAVLPFQVHYQRSVVLQVNFSGADVGEEKVLFKVTDSDACTAAWNHNPMTWDQYSAAVGCSSGKTYLVCPGGQQYTRSFLSSSSVFAVAIASQDPVLFTGHRSGVITSHDLRSSSKQCVMEPKYAKLHSSVIRLHRLQDSNYLISQAFNSTVGVWDLRMRRKVWTFAGHTNTVKNCQSFVDRNETFLAAVGSDRCIRFWSLRVGSLLRTIEPAEYAASHASHAEPVLSEYASPPTSSILPIVCYSDTLGGHKGFPGCMIANGMEMSIFRL